MTQRTDRSGITCGLRETDWPEGPLGKRPARGRANRATRQTTVLYHSQTRLGKHRPVLDPPRQAHLGATPEAPPRRPPRHPRWPGGGRPARPSTGWAKSRRAAPPRSADRKRAQLPRPTAPPESRYSRRNGRDCCGRRPYCSRPPIRTRRGASGTRDRSNMSVTPLALAISVACPTRPNPVTSVHAWTTPGPVDARDAAAERLRARIEATAASATSEAARPRLIAVETIPVPTGLVNTTRPPGSAPAFAHTWSGWTVPVTA